MSRCELWIELDRLAELSQRLIEIFLGGQHDAQPVVSFRGLRIQIDRLAISSNCFVEIFLLEQLPASLLEFLRRFRFLGVLRRGGGNSENGSGNRDRP